MWGSCVTLLDFPVVNYSVTANEVRSRTVTCDGTQFPLDILCSRCMKQHISKVSTLLTQHSRMIVNISLFFKGSSRIQGYFNSWHFKIDVQQRCSFLSRTFDQHRSSGYLYVFMHHLEYLLFFVGHDYSEFGYFNLETADCLHRTLFMLSKLGRLISLFFFVCWVCYG